MPKTIAGRQFAEIEDLLEDLPYGPEEVPTDITDIRRVHAASAIHTNYLLAAILIEVREIKYRLTDIDPRVPPGDKR